MGNHFNCLCNLLKSLLYLISAKYHMNFTSLCCFGTILLSGKSKHVVKFKIGKGHMLNQFPFT